MTLQRDWLVRALRAHNVKDQFRIVAGPTANPGQDFAVIEWDTNYPATSLVEYGTSAGDLSQSESSTALVLSHSLTLTGLAAGQTYFYQVTSVSDAAVSVSSVVVTFQTPGDPIASDAGLRYGIYGDTAKGFPAYPTIGGSVKMVPAATAAAGMSAVNSWLAEYVSDNDTIVFDSSGGGTDYGSGTLIAGSESLHGFAPGGDNLLSGVTFWGYNVRCTNDGSSGGDNINLAGIWTEPGGYQDCEWLGFDLWGPRYADGYDVATHEVNVNYGKGSGFALTAFKDCKVMDCRISEHLNDCFQIFQSDLSDGNHYSGFTYPDGLEIGYCIFQRNHRQGFTIQQGSNVNMHHVLFEDIAMMCIDAEDVVADAQYSRIVGLKVLDCRFNRWMWVYNSYNDNAWRSQVIALNQKTGSVDEQGDLEVGRCTFQGGPQGWGNDDVESLYGSAGSTIITAGLPWNPGTPPWEVFDGTAAGATVSVYVHDNICDLPAEQQGEASSGAIDLRRCFAIIRNGDSVVVEDNQPQGRPIWIDNFGTVSTDNNDGVSEYVT